MKRFDWKTIDELSTNAPNIMVFKSLHELAPEYISNLFTRTSQLTSRNLRGQSFITLGSRVG